MDIIKLEKTDSTNTWTAAHEKEIPSPALVWAWEQTAGRGQRGNSWESEPGKNITASLVFHPENFPAIRQFEISETIALSIVDFLEKIGIHAKVKWPNDIYVGDRKICGILVEHLVTGSHISRTIAGFGININQTLFLSDAPNPVSAAMITGKEYDLMSLVLALSECLESNLSTLNHEGKNHKKFLENLWRGDHEIYDFFDKRENCRISARIEHIANNGILVLRTIDGEKKEYAFKEVEFIL